jgi:hypothetical protein
MTRLLVALALTVTAATGAAVAVPAPASADGCAVRWGSQPKTATATRPATLTGVRTGQHTCFDRLVLDVSTNGTGWSVRYVSAVRTEGRGAVLPLRGGAFLEVVEKAATTRRLPMPGVAGYRTFRQVADGGSFEGQTTLGLGVRARLPFRVLVLDRRVVVDVAHHW